MTDCGKYQDLISRLIDEDLSEQEKTELNNHLERCEECAALYRAFSAVSLSLSEDLEDVPSTLKENVMSAVRNEGANVKKNSSKIWKTWLAAAACLALIIVGINQFGMENFKAASEASSAELSMVASATDLGAKGNAELPEEEENEKINAANTADMAVGSLPDENKGNESYDQTTNDCVNKPTMSVVAPDGDEYSVADVNKENELRTILDQRNENQLIVGGQGIMAPNQSQIKEYTIVFSDGTEYYVCVDGDSVYCTNGDETYKIVQNSEEFESKLFEILK